MKKQFSSVKFMFQVLRKHPPTITITFLVLVLSLVTYAYVAMMTDLFGVVENFVAYLLVWVAIWMVDLVKFEFRMLDIWAEREYDKLVNLDYTEIVVDFGKDAEGKPYLIVEEVWG